MATSKVPLMVSAEGFKPSNGRVKADCVHRFATRYYWWARTNSNRQQPSYELGVITGFTTGPYIENYRNCLTFNS